MARNTTVWGVVIAVGLVGATLALNAPGGSNSIAGRSITWTMGRLFPQQPPPPAPPPRVAREPVAASVPAPLPPRVQPAVTATPAEPLAEPHNAPPPAKIADPLANRRSAVAARANMAHAPTGVKFRNVYAVTILGVFNAERPGEPFLGFCGEISVPEGESWGRPGWKPFFVSETVSTPQGQTPFLDQANPGTLAKCANAKPSEDYSDVFNAGPTDQRLEPWQRHPPRAP